MNPIECLINQKAPASPHTTRAVGAEGDGRGAGGIVEKTNFEQ